jgi:2-desacetyl-2-hydroxyethyl bacteriochlorophyllide A dehydrogenase
VTTYARGLWLLGDRRAEIRELPLPPLGLRDVLVRTEVSAISAGSELAFYRGLVPPGTELDTALAGYRRPVSYPIAYGYAAVGTIASVGAEVERNRIGRRVFAYHPHEEAFVCAADELIDVPCDLDPARAALLATMETAVTLVMDAAPVIGEAVGVIGQGAVGLCVGALVTRSLAAEIALIDRFPARLEIARMMSSGRSTCLDPDRAARELDGRLDVAIDVSGQSQGMQLGLGLLRFGGRLIAGSWLHGDPAIRLGGRAHRARQTISFSQVSTLAPELSGRFDRARRHAIAFEWLARLPLDPLVTHRWPLERAAEVYRLLDEAPGELGQVLLEHSWQA